MNRLIADIGLVHGAGFESHGVASGYSLAQAELGAHLVEDGAVENIIVCGRGPNTTDTYEYSEAELMKMHLIQQGVDEDVVHIEDMSSNTLGNLVYGSKVAKDIGAESLVGVSRPSQKPRALLAARYVLPRTGIDLRGYRTIEEDVKLTSVGRELLQVSLLEIYLQTHRRKSPVELAVGYTSFIEWTRLSKVKKARYKKGSDRDTSESAESVSNL
jgi:uncharacterized SAM-binding protein YcdF (DUF218 family)